MTKTMARSLVLGCILISLRSLLIASIFYVLMIVSRSLYTKAQARIASVRIYDLLFDEQRTPPL